MPFSPLDALMQVAAPKRSIEPPLRNDGPGAFRPALEQAYQAESPRSAPAPQPVEQKPKAKDSSASGEKRESEQPTDDAAAAAESADGMNAATDQEESDSADSESEDAAEISTEGAAAAGAIHNAKSVEQKVVVKSSDAEASEVKEVDAKASAKETKKQADAAAAAAALAEGEVEASDFDGESASDQGEGGEVSTLNSTRRRQLGDDRKGDEPSERAAAASGKAGEKKTPESSVDATAPSGNEEIDQIEDVVVEAAAEPAGESREHSRIDETAAKSDESQPVGPKGETPGSGDANSIPLHAKSDVDSSAADVTASSTSSAPAVVESAPPSDTTPRTTGALDRLMAGHSLKSKDSSEPNGMPTVDRARFVQRVEGAMKAAQQKDGRIQVRLSPPDLGSIKIELAVQNGVLSAKLEAETPAARNLLLDSLPALRERLALQDIRVEKFDVDVRRDSGGNDGSGQADDRTADQSGERQSGRPRTEAARAISLPAASPRGLAGAASATAGLDVRV